MNRFKKNNYLYDWISCVIPNRLYFGSQPNEHMLEQIKEKGFTVIVNVKEDGKQINPCHVSLPSNLFGNSL